MDGALTGEHALSNEPELAIRVRDVVVGFGEKIILDGLNLDVRTRSEVTAIDRERKEVRGGVALSLPGLERWCVHEQRVGEGARHGEGDGRRDDPTRGSVERVRRGGFPARRRRST